MPVYNGFVPSALGTTFVSGAASNATFAVSGLKAADQPLFAIYCAGGSTHPVSGILGPSQLTFTDGACCTNDLDTSTGTVALVYLDASAL